MSRPLKKWAITDDKAWIPLVALGGAYANKSWDYRDKNEKVPQDKMKDFQEAIQKSVFFLQSAVTLDPPDPYPYVEMLSVGTNLCWTGPIERKFLKKALEISPSNYDALWLMRDYYSPMGCGNESAERDFMAEYLEPAPPDSDIRMLIADVYTDFWALRDHPNSYAKDPEVWVPLRAAYESFLSRHPGDLKVRALYAYWAYHGDHFQEAKEQFDALGDHWNANPVYWLHKDYYLNARKRANEMVAKQQKK